MVTGLLRSASISCARATSVVSRGQEAESVLAPKELHNFKAVAAPAELFASPVLVMSHKGFFAIGAMTFGFHCPATSMPAANSSGWVDMSR